ncbi:uncharacterized protein LOC110856482 [Folsomia candida]|uniref:uncharacterized protein LOC110856482 n=1 Tax=Folsomia candida TaxID=158441 RepID=UPI000B8F0FBE|nr:uncharacterized protein LOC110856482 [Folsomia candida]
MHSSPIKVIVLVVALFKICHVQALCPPSDSLVPCICSQYNGWEVISCSNIRGRINFAPIFARDSSAIKNQNLSSYSLTFNTLRITGCSGLLEIPRGSFADLSFLYVDISANPNLDWISPRAFDKSSYGVTKELRLYDNYLWNPAPYTNDIFKFVTNFKMLEKVDLGMNRISSVPKNAFASASTIQRIDFRYNKITSIGQNAFSATTNLTLLEFTYNSITPAGIHPQAFSGLGN